MTVAYRTGSVTATAGSDYYATSGTLTFSPGTVQRTIGVTIVGNTLVEPDEYLAVWLSNPVGAVLASTYPGLVTIRNDD